MKKSCHLKKAFLTLFTLSVLIFMLQLLHFKQKDSEKEKRIFSKANVYKGKQRNELQFKPTFTNYSRLRQCETIHIAVICAGAQSSQQVATLIKSILFHRKNPLHVHFVVDNHSKLIVSHLFQTWDVGDFTISFYLASNYVEKVAWIPNTHYSGKYGMMKLAILSILPEEIPKIILLDTDIVFAADIADLWHQFDKFGQRAAIGVVENQSDWYLGTLYENYTPWPALGRGFNTGVVLLMCDRLRLFNWNAEWDKVARKVLKHIPCTTLADQDVINSLIKEYPSLVYNLPCYWNLQMSDTMRPELCYLQYPNEIKALHFNARRKYKATQRRFTSLNILYQTIVELNGELVRLPNFHCKNTSNFNNFLDLRNDIFEDDEICQEFESSISSLYRTHLYYLPFNFDSVRKMDVSIVVHLSFDRFPMFEKLCSFWKGPVSAAIFVSDSDTQHLINFVKKSEVLKSRENVAYHFVFKKATDQIYPINLLRNVALHYAITEYVFLYDVDFVPMPGLHDYITSHLIFSNETDLTAFIIPAFESLLYKFKMPLTKSELLKELSSGSITSFRSYIWPKGHAATDYEKWKTSTKEYNVQWEVDFEPYVVVSRRMCPSYDKRFTGFGWNKISHIMELDAAGFRFIVLPFGFIVHLPHSPSIDLIKYRTIPNYRECLQSAKNSFIEHLSRKYGVKTKYGALYD